MFAPGSYDEIPLDAMRRTIAARLVEAKQNGAAFLSHWRCFD